MKLKWWRSKQDIELAVAKAMANKLQIKVRQAVSQGRSDVDRVNIKTARRLQEAHEAVKACRKTLKHAEGLYQEVLVQCKNYAGAMNKWKEDAKPLYRMVKAKEESRFAADKRFQALRSREMYNAKVHKQEVRALQETIAILRQTSLTNELVEAYAKVMDHRGTRIGRSGFRWNSDGHSDVIEIGDRLVVLGRWVKTTRGKYPIYTMPGSTLPPP